MRVLLSFKNAAEAVALIKQCEHEVARFLLSLIPASGLPPLRSEVASLFDREDARCCCWAALFGKAPKDELLRRSAEGGYAMGQGCYARKTSTKMISFSGCRKPQQRVMWMPCASLASVCG